MLLPLSLEGLQHHRRGDGELVYADADGVGYGVRDGGQGRNEGGLSDAAKPKRVKEPSELIASTHRNTQDLFS